MKTAIVLGTRPEIIKLSPLIRLLGEQKQDFFVVHTGQHFSKNMSEQFFEELNISHPKYNLSGQPLAQMTQGIIQTFKKEKPDVIIVQGDTKSALAGALAASFLSIKLAHIEAGLRSFDDSMPEETNRIVIDRLSNVLFCPSQISKQNLNEEKVQGNIYVAGNTISDVIAENITKISDKKYSPEDYALLTLHRPANVDNPEDLKSMLNIVAKISNKHKLKIIFPVHPRTKNVLKKYQINIDQNIKIISPMQYLPMLRALRDAKLVLTDSGGLQEEACILGVPCITLRENTERPETVHVGANVVAGKKEQAILSAVQKMLKSKRDWLNPFGENVSEKILSILVSGKE